MVPVLFMVTQDPRRSPRPAEAIRIAAGVGSWGKVKVSIYLRGPAILTLQESGDELMDGDDLGRYWPIVQGWNRPVWVQAGAKQMTGLSEPFPPIQEISDEDLARLASEQRYVLRF